MLSQIPDCYYAERVALNTTANIMKAKKAIKKAFQNQIDGVGYSFIEVVSTCPTNWGLDPMKSLEYIEEKMLPEFPLGVVRDR